MTTSTIHLGGTTRLDRGRLAVFGALMQAGTRPLLNGVVPLGVRRSVLGALGRLMAPVPKDIAVSEVDLGGVRTWRMTPQNAEPDRAVFALHGGGYNYGGLGTHGGAYARLGASLRATVWMPDYALVPEHAPEVVIEDAVRAWSALHDVLPAGARVAMTGDSAGGGLSIATACESRDRGLPSPACLLLHSPWVDADPDLVAQRPTDRLLHTGLMTRDGRLWRGGRPADDPVISPIHRDLHGLPPTFVQWGQAESLHLDAERLVAKLQESGNNVTGEAYPAVWHVAFVHVPTLPEANAWLRRTTDFASSFLGR